MPKRVFIIHGWGGSPEEAIHNWLKKSLEKKGFSVFVPEMPDTENPVIEKWVTHLGKIAKNPDKDTYFIGHSIGCQTILRYLENISSKLGGVILVAPWMHLQGDRIRARFSKNSRSLDENPNKMEQS